MDGSPSGYGVPNNATEHTMNIFPSIVGVRFIEPAQSQRCKPAQFQRCESGNPVACLHMVGAINGAPTKPPDKFLHTLPMVFPQYVTYIIKNFTSTLIELHKKSCYNNKA
jgi:hypothetical protein